MTIRLSFSFFGDELVHAMGKGMGKHRRVQLSPPKQPAEQQAGDEIGKQNRNDQ